MKLPGAEWLIRYVVRPKSNLSLLFKNENHFYNQRFMKFAAEVPDVQRGAAHAGSFPQAKLREANPVRIQFLPVARLNDKHTPFPQHRPHPLQRAQHFTLIAAVTQRVAQTNHQVDGFLDSCWQRLPVTHLERHLEILLGRMPTCPHHHIAAGICAENLVATPGKGKGRQPCPTRAVQDARFAECREDRLQLLDLRVSRQRGVREEPLVVCRERLVLIVAIRVKPYFGSALVTNSSKSRFSLVCISVSIYSMWPDW